MILMMEAKFDRIVELLEAILEAVQTDSEDKTMARLEGVHDGILAAMFHGRDD